MDLNLTGKNLEISPQARDYISLKLNKINRYLPNILSFDVVASREMTRSPDQQFIVQATIDSNGTLIRGEERAQDLHAAADKVYEVLSRQIEHYKGKLPYKKGRRPQSIRTSTTEVTAGVADESLEEGPRVVKNKKFELTRCRWKKPSTKCSCWVTIFSSTIIRTPTTSTCCINERTATWA